MGSRDQGLVREHPWGDRELSDLYDLFPFDDDIPLYLDLAREARGPILELACGTGRVLVPLGSAGFDVVGLDRSLPMLRRARSKLQGAALPVRLIQADLRRFALSRGFALAYIAVRSFCYLQSRAEQLVALRCVRAHLVPGGAFVLDLVNPRLEWLAQPDGSRRQDLARELPGGGVVTRVETAVRTDTAKQLRVIRSEYELIEKDGSVRKRIVEWSLRYLHRFEAELLLERAGFEVEAVWGDYERGAFTEASPSLVLFARAR